MKELVFAVAIWGHAWLNSCVLCFCDNEAVVAILKSGTSNDKKSMSLLLCLYFFNAYFNITLLSSHIDGATNTLADALSRNNTHLFFSKFPQASPTPSPIPLLLINMLLQQETDWTSPHRSPLFKASCSQLLPHLHSQAMLQHTDATVISAEEHTYSRTPP